MSERVALSDRMRRHRVLSDKATVSPSDLPEDLPLSLKEVCKRVFGGAISRATLIAEHRRGNLEIFKIGRAYFTTPKGIMMMMMIEKCRVGWGPPKIERLAGPQKAISARMAMEAALAENRARRKVLSGCRRADGK